jgi:hypothetical protein
MKMIQKPSNKLWSSWLNNKILVLIYNTLLEIYQKKLYHRGTKSGYIKS